MTAEILARLINDSLRKHGFKKKGSTWHLESPECISVLNVQRSQWGDKYYINLGVLVKQLDNIPSPKEYQCHFRDRLSHIVGNSAKMELEPDFEDPSSTEEQKAQTVREAIETHAIPLLLSLQTLEGIKRTFSEKRISPAFAADKLTKLLGISG